MPLDIAAEVAWLNKYPAFAQRPANVREFMGKNYLNIENGIRQSIMDELIEIMGEEVSGERFTKYPLAMITGGIGIGKTTFASIILPYLAHWVLCLHDPQEFFNLLPGTRIAFMQMSTSAQQALDVVFGDVKARIEHSKWFKLNARFDPKYTKQLKFPKDIWILPGDSHETTFEGYNILGGILDEADSHIVTEKNDYAEMGFDTINNRITSRFQDRGFFVVIGQMKSNSGFAARKYKELEADPKAHVKRMSIWESMGDAFYRGLDPNGELKKFAYDIKRHEIVPEGVAQRIEGSNILWIPELYLPQFKTHPEKALKDLAGFPPAVGDPFISMVHKIEACRDRWIHNANLQYWSDPENAPQDTLVRTPVRVDGRIEPWFHAPNQLKRVGHIDIAYSAEGDALGFSMGHVRDLVTIDGEEKPYIVIDLMLRMKAPAGGEIMLQDIRHLIYAMRDEFKFRLVRVTMDGFQCLSGDTKVPLLNGTTLTMRELAEQYSDGGVEVYSFDGEKITAGKCTRAWKTGEREVVDVLLDNGETVRCTPDHPFMLRDGSYREASDLRCGDSLMPLNRRITPDDWKGPRGYEQVLQPNMTSIDPRGRAAGRWQFTHAMVAGPVEEGFVRHHVDFIKLNNASSNLRIMTVEDHLALHREQSSANFKTCWADPAYRAKTSAAVSKSNTERVGREARRYRHDITLEGLQAVRHLSRRAVTTTMGWSQDAIYARVREAGYSGWTEFRRTANVNHRVVSVVPAGREDVYDLQVTDHHNFAISSGIFVHNSTDTRQQLTKRRFESDIISVDKNLIPYSDLRDAIYEDRIEFPEYMVHLNPGDDRTVEIAVKELAELVDAGKKIDHPTNGSKDVADTLAAVVFTLMGDRTYRRKAVSLGAPLGYRPGPTTRGSMHHPAVRDLSSMRAPLPPRQ